MWTIYCANCEDEHQCWMVAIVVVVVAVALHDDDKRREIKVKKKIKTKNKYTFSFWCCNWIDGKVKKSIPRMKITNEIF